MKQKMFLLFLIGWLPVLFVRSQERDVYLAAQDVLSVRVGEMWLTDEYLSALPYSGMVVSLQNEWWNRFSTDNDAWTNVAELKLTGGLLQNTAGSNAILAFGGTGAFGAYYNYRFIPSLTLLGGAVFDCDFLGRYMVSSVNKPYSMDLASNLNLSAGLAWTFVGRHSNYRLRYMVRTPFLGCMFVPEMGESYYELSQTAADRSVATSFGNKLGLKHELTFDMRFRRSSWRVGVEHEYLRYHANNLHFSREQFSLMVATVFDVRVFGGNRKPENLKSIWP